jgi:hypothetical protein
MTKDSTEAIMKTTLLALVILIGMVAADAVPARAAGLTHFVGRLVEAEFVSTAGCEVTTTFVFAVDDSTGSPFAYAQYVREDVCTGTLLGYGTAGRPLGPGELTIDASVQHATLNAALTGTRHDGSPLTFTLALQWDASGRPFIFIAGSHVRSPNSTFGIHGMNRFYDADVSGSFLDGPSDLAAADFTRGRVGLDSSGTLVLDAALLSTASASGSPSGSIVEENDRVSFNEVGAAFGATDASGCVFSQAFLSAYDGTRQTPGGPARPESLLSVFGFSVDNCLGHVLLEGYAERALQPGELSVSGNLDTAQIAGSIVLADRISGGPVPLHLQVTWTAAGAVTTTISHDVSVRPFTTHHGIMTFQPSSAAGDFPGLLEAVTEGGGISHIQGGEVSHDR